MQAFVACSSAARYRMRMTYRTLSLALLTAAFATSAQAGDVKPTHVVELFTSQGCSSCPPANKFVGKLAEDADTLVLSYGVTYWDYLGWTDTFGDPAFTQRQRDYRDAFGASNIYTPQIVLGGSAHSPRYSKSDVTSMPLQGDGVGLRTRVDGDAMCFTLDAAGDFKADIVTFTPGEQAVDVKRGENGGRQLRLTNVVKDVSEWNISGGETEACFLPQPNEAYAALVHDAVTARILDAAVIH